MPGTGSTTVQRWTCAAGRMLPDPPRWGVVQTRSRPRVTVKGLADGRDPRKTRTLPAKARDEACLTGLGRP